MWNLEEVMNFSPSLIYQNLQHLLHHSVGLFPLIVIEVCVAIIFLYI